MNSVVKKLIEIAGQNPKTLVFPEGTDERIPVAAAEIAALGFAKPIVLGKPDEVAEIVAKAGKTLDGVQVIDPRESELLPVFTAEYTATRGVKEGVAKSVVRKPLAFGGMMVRTGRADGMVAGVASATASVIQAASVTVELSAGVSAPSSFFLIVMPESDGRVFVFADCGVNIQPTSRELAEIGVVAAANAKKLLGQEPVVAFLSLSTKGSATHPDVDKVVEAVRLAREMAPDLCLDGELQVDAALSARVAAKKAPESPVKGQANVLVFPDLDAGNIGYKLAQYLGGAQAIGPIMQGFAKPVNDMSRGASVEDVVAVAAVTALQAS